MHPRHLQNQNEKKKEQEYNWIGGWVGLRGLRVLLSGVASPRLSKREPWRCDTGERMRRPLGWRRGEEFGGEDEV